jgi:hypothetical protein
MKPVENILSCFFHDHLALVFSMAQSPVSPPTENPGTKHMLLITKTCKKRQLFLFAGDFSCSLMLRKFRGVLLY